MIKRNAFYFLASFFTLTALLLPQRVTTSAPNSHSDKLIPIYEHIIDDKFHHPYSAYDTDVDGDGDMDVLGAATEYDGIHWSENEGDKTFTQHALDPDFEGACEVYATDMDGDGDIDIVAIAASLEDTLAWWENDGNQNFSKHVIKMDFDWAIDAYAADIDGDTDMDVLGVAAYDNTFAWWEQGSPLEQAYLPFMVKNSGPPTAPVLNNIANPEGDNIYEVSWGAVERATSYSLEEDDNPTFASPATVYQGTGTTTNQSISGVGTYYYRVQARNAWGDSPWSNIVSVMVTNLEPIVVPEPGIWDCSYAQVIIRFTVSSDSNSASNGRISISCHTSYLPGPAAIEGSSFQLENPDDLGFIAVTFDDVDHGSGSFGFYYNDHYWIVGTMTCTS